MRIFTIKFFKIPGYKCLEGNELVGTKQKEATSFVYIIQEMEVSCKSVLLTYF